MPTDPFNVKTGIVARGGQPSVAVKGQKDPKKLAAMFKKWGIGAGSTAGMADTGGGNRSSGGAGAAPVSTLAGLPQTPELAALIAKGIIKEGMPPEQALAILSIQGLIGQLPIDIDALQAQIAANYAQTGNVTGDAADWMQQMFGQNMPGSPPPGSQYVNGQWLGPDGQVIGTAPVEDAPFVPSDPELQAQARLYAADPMFQDYGNTLAEIDETAQQNQATDQSWFDKQQQMMTDYYNSLQMGMAAGTVATGPGGGGGGGGGRGGRGGGGGGDGSGDLGFGDDKTTYKETEDMSDKFTQTESFNFPGMLQELDAWANTLPPDQGQLVHDLTAGATSPSEIIDKGIAERIAATGEVQAARDVVTGNDMFTRAAPSQWQTDLASYLDTSNQVLGDNPATPDTKEWIYSDAPLNDQGQPILTPKTPEQEAFEQFMGPLVARAYKPTVGPPIESILSGRSPASMVAAQNQMAAAAAGTGTGTGTGSSGNPGPQRNAMLDILQAIEYAQSPGAKWDAPTRAPLSEQSIERMNSPEYEDYPFLADPDAVTQPTNAPIGAPDVNQSSHIPQRDPDDYIGPGNGPEDQIGVWIPEPGHIFPGQPGAAAHLAQHEAGTVGQAQPQTGGRTTADKLSSIQSIFDRMQGKSWGGNQQPGSIPGVNFGGAGGALNTTANFASPGRGLIDQQAIDALTQEGGLPVDTGQAESTPASRNEAAQARNAGASGLDSFKIASLANAVLKLTGQQQAPASAPTPSQTPDFSAMWGDLAPQPASDAAIWGNEESGPGLRPDLLDPIKADSYRRYSDLRNLSPQPDTFEVPMGSYWQEPEPEEETLQREAQIPILAQMIQTVQEKYNPFYAPAIYRENNVSSSGTGASITNQAVSYEDAAGGLTGVGPIADQPFDELDIVDDEGGDPLDEIYGKVGYSAPGGGNRDILSALASRFGNNASTPVNKTPLTRPNVTPKVGAANASSPDIQKLLKGISKVALINKAFKKPGKGTGKKKMAV